MPISQTADFILRRRFQNRARQPDVIIEIAFRFRDTELARQHRRGKIFGARLAVAAGNREHFERKRFSIIRGEILIGPQRVVRAEQARKCPGRFPFQLESTIAPAAPAFAAASTNLWPSKFSPAQRDE